MEVQINKILENKEAVKGTIGFDFIFQTGEDGIKKVYCVELNGHESGIEGTKDLSSKRADKNFRDEIFSRTKRDKRYFSHVDEVNSIRKEIEKGPMGSFPDLTYTEQVKEKVLQFLARSVKSKKMFLNSNKNSLEIQEICDDKKIQEEYIPNENRIRSFKNKNEVLNSHTDIFVVKQNFLRGGNGIFILDRKNLLENIDRFDIEDRAQPAFFDIFFVQEFIEADDAENGEEGFASAVRLLLDFTVTKDEIKIDKKYAYQRVSPYSKRGEESENKKFVVNKSTGARSVDISENEEIIILPVAIRIIENLKPVFLKSKF